MFGTVGTRVAGLTVVWLVAACSGGYRGLTAPTSPPINVSQFLQHSTAHFTFQYAERDAPSIAETAARAEAEYDRIVRDLGSPNVARTTVILHPTQASIRAAAGNLTTVATLRGFVQGPGTIHALSPNQSELDVSYANAIRTIVHEFVHCVTLYVNPGFSNNPRWLWETVAVFETNEFYDPQHVQLMASSQPPSLAQLNGFNDDIYFVGYTIGEFIVSRWGREGLIELIRNGGNTAGVTGLDPTEFLAHWFAFAKRQQ